MPEQWIEHPTILKGESVELIPLEKYHFEELYNKASDKKLWEYIPLNCSDKDTFEMAYITALEEREKKNQYPFVIYHKITKELIGSTRFLEIFPKDKKLEIGWTWITQKYWATEINLECKLLLLTFSFENLNARRVQIKTDENNIRSRKAIEKIGGKFEGILRKDKIRENGTSRNAAYFSVTDDEWEGVKRDLSEKLREKKKAFSI